MRDVDGMNGDARAASSSKIGTEIDACALYYRIYIVIFLFINSRRDC